MHRQDFFHSEDREGEEWGRVVSLESVRFKGNNCYIFTEFFFYFHSRFYHGFIGGKPENKKGKG